MNIQTQIILAEQLTNALKEIERLQNELEQVRKGRDFFVNENAKLKELIKE